MPIPSRRRLDHLVLPSRDLEAQAAFYGRLGFQVGARNRHPWGTENRLVQFDGCFLELLTLGEGGALPEHAPRAFSFGAHARDFLRDRGQGFSLLAFDSPDAAADARWLDQAGLSQFEPFHFGRKGRRPDGGEMEVSFTLAFAMPAALPGLGLFFCQQHQPQNFWNAAAQVHENTALGVGHVVAVHGRPALAAALKPLLDGEPALEDDGATFTTQAGELSVWSPVRARRELGDDPVFADDESGRFAAIVFPVARLDAAELCLRRGNVPHLRHGERIVVPSEAAFGVRLAFEEAKQRP